MSWISIDEQRPKIEQPVFYWFGFFDRVYAGYYDQYTNNSIYPDGIFGDTFYGKHGFLTNDVTYWMPRNEADENIPEGPSSDQKANCKYHPIK